MKAGDYSDFEYSDLNGQPELKKAIYKEVKSQLVEVLYRFSDRKLGIKNESDMRNKIYERQQITTRFYGMLNEFERQYEDLDALFLCDPKKLLIFFRMKINQISKNLEKMADMDLIPDDVFLEELTNFCLSIKDRVKYIQYRNLAKGVVENLELDLFVINLIKQYIFNRQDAGYDIKELSIYYKQDYGYNIAKLVAEIILHFVHLHDIQTDKSIEVEDRVVLEKDLKEEIDSRIFVGDSGEKEQVYRRIKKIIEIGYTLTYLNMDIKKNDEEEAKEARRQILELLINPANSGLIDGFVFEDMFFQAFEGKYHFKLKLNLIERIVKGYRIGHYDDRIMAVAMLHLHNTDPDTERASFYRILSALIEKQPKMIDSYTSLLIDLRDILKRFWNESSFRPPLPLILHIWKTFDIMLRGYIKNFQEYVDITRICEQSFNRVFIYDITRRPATVKAAPEKKKSFEKVISTKYDTSDIAIPMHNVLEICPELLDSHFITVDDLFVKLKPGVSIRQDARIKALVMHSREDITLWLQRTRLQKLSENLMTQSKFTKELEDLTNKIPLQDITAINRRVK